MFRNMFFTSFKLLHGLFSLKSRGLAECQTFGHIALTDPYPKSFTRFDVAKTDIALVLQIFSDRGFRWIYLPTAAAAVPLPDRVHPVFGTGIRNGTFRLITLGRSTGSQTENQSADQNRMQRPLSKGWDPWCWTPMMECEKPKQRGKPEKQQRLSGKRNVRVQHTDHGSGRNAATSVKKP